MGGAVAWVFRPTGRDNRCQTARQEERGEQPQQHERGPVVIRSNSTKKSMAGLLHYTTTTYWLMGRHPLNLKSEVERRLQKCGPHGESNEGS